MRAEPTSARRYDSLAKSRGFARRTDTLRSWTRSGTLTHPVPDNARPAAGMIETLSKTSTEGGGGADGFAPTGFSGSGGAK